MKLVFRVWPMCRETHLAIARMKTIPITGMMINKYGHLEAWHQIHGIKAYRFELADDDADLLASVGCANAKLCTDMLVHAPGTTDITVKQDCWLEAKVDVYPDANCRIGKFSCEDVTIPRPATINDEDLDAGLIGKGIKYSKAYIIECEDDFDEEILCREVVEHDAVIVLKPSSVPLAKLRKFMKRTKYWVVPGKKPDEPGGAFCGYQFCDRIFRWVHRGDPATLKERLRTITDKMHEITREKGRATRRKYFVDETVNRFAKKVGWPRQRVTSRFLNDGVIDLLLRSVDALPPPHLARDAKSYLRGRVTDAVSALEFYYRAVESLNRQGAGQ